MSYKCYCGNLDVERTAQTMQTWIENFLGVFDEVIGCAFLRWVVLGQEITQIRDSQFIKYTPNRLVDKIH